MIMDEFKISRRNIIFVISGPSGVGKTLITRNLLEVVPDVSFSISTTTRPPRNEEVEGVDYYFVSESIFSDMLKNNQFIEHATVYEHRYGTTKREIERIFGEKNDALLDIDTQGAEQINEKYPDSVMIFIMPPDLNTLKERIMKRERRINSEIEERLSNAREEISKAHLYDYIVINAYLTDAIEVIRAIIEAERHSSQHMLKEVK
jgi:guanylate kinase